jgi:hypothetical protein
MYIEIDRETIDLVVLTYRTRRRLGEAAPLASALATYRALHPEHTDDEARLVVDGIIRDLDGG